MADEWFKFINNVPAGIAKDEDHNSVAAHPYLGKVGKLIESYDTGGDVSRPTGYEPVKYLVEFEDGKRLWIPGSTYRGFDSDTGEDFYTDHLKRV